MRSIITMALTDLRLLWRDRLAFFWVIGFPFLFAIFFGSIFSGGGGSARGMKIVVSDQDNTEYSQKFVVRLDKSESFAVSELPRDEAVDLVRRGKQTAYVVLKKGFENMNLFAPSDISYIELGIDPSRRAESGFIEGLLTQALFQMQQEIMTKPDLMRPRLKEQIAAVDSSANMNPGDKNMLKNLFSSLDNFYGAMDSLGADSTGHDTATTTTSSGVMQLNIERADVSTEREGPRSAFEIMFPSASLWGLLACAATFAGAVVREREQGTYLRLRLAPISYAQILAGKGLACFIACVGVAAIIMTAGHFIFGVRIADLPLLIFAVICAALCFVGLMMFLSSLGRTEQSVSSAGWSILLVMGMLGGAMFPLAFMPKWMQSISHISPIKWAILSIEGAVWRGFTFGELFIPAAILLGVGGVGFAIGVILLRRMDNI